MYKVGDKVIIISRPKRHGWDCYDKILYKVGEIVYVPHGKHNPNYAIKVEGYTNPKRSWLSGAYWLRPQNFVRINDYDTY